MNGGEREGGRFSFYKSRRWNINITLSIVARARENFSSRLRREREIVPSLEGLWPALEKESGMVGADVLPCSIGTSRNRN